MSRWNEVLRVAVNRLDGGNRWIKGSLTECDGDGTVIGYCTIGAISGENGSDEHYEYLEPVFDIVIDVINEQFPHHVDVHQDILRDRSELSRKLNIISSFNDGRHRPFSDIEMVLEKAILKAEEAV